jgi:hypothetical protein
MTSTESRSRDVCNGLACVLFALALSAPILSMIARGDSPKTLTAENRNAAPEPALPRDLDSACKYPAQFEAWWSDVFGGREALLRGHALLQWIVFRASPAPAFFPGRDGWFFYTGDDSRAVWRGLREVPASRLRAWCKALETRRDILKQVGVEYLYVISPNKQTIYPEYLPASESGSGSTPREQLLAFAATHSDAPILDLYPALLAEKQHDRPELGDFTFHRLGSHWSSRGAWAAVHAIVARLAEKFAWLHPIERDDCECVLRPDCDRDDDVPARLHLEGVLAEPSFAFREKRGVHARIVRASAEHPPRSMEFATDRKDGEKMMLVHDSFGPEFREQLAEYPPSLTTIWRYSLPIEEILILRPRIVVQEFTERMLIHDPVPTASIAVLFDLALFASLPRGKPDLGPIAALREIQPRSGTEMHFDERGGVTSLVIITKPEKESVVLPEIAVAMGSRLVLRVVLTSPRASAMSVWFRRRGEGHFDNQQRVAVRIEAGRNDVCFAIPVDDLAGSLLLRPGLEPGQYRLHGVDQRILAR